MSRIIVKNLPKFVTEKQLSQNFKDLGEVTDCKIARDPNGMSRKFGFVGFKDKNAANLARKNYHNTYIGVSKIQVDRAKTRDEEQFQQERKSKKVEKNKKQEKVQKQKFDQYKKLVQESVKKSWDDLIVGNDTQAEKKVQEPKKSKKERKQQKKKNKNQKLKGEERQEETVKSIKAPNLTEKNKKYVNKPLGIDQTRLYITNIPYQIEEQDIKKAFQKFGTITKIKLPKQYDGKTKGFVFITFQLPEQAMRAFSEIDNKVYFGRILHAKPAVEDIGSIIKNGKQAEYEQRIKQQYGDTQEQKTSFKKKKKRQMRDKLNDTTSWNTLFLNPNTILQYMAKKLKLTKSQILLDNQNLAPKIALAEAEVIQETKQWMIRQNINTSFLDLDRNLCERSERVLLVKNLNYRVQENEIKELFEFYGVVQKVLLCPNRSIAIVQYENKDYAKNALERLQNSKFKNSFLFLEMAPVHMLTEKQLDVKIMKMQEENAEGEELSRIIYVKNLNFASTDEALEQLFTKNIQQPKSVKIIRDRQTNKSLGYGFIELSSHEVVVKAIKKLQNHILDGHMLLFSISKKQTVTQDFEKIKQLKEKMKHISAESNKLLVRNIAFQATKDDVRQLFKHFGSLRMVRLPKKMNGQHRGYGFVEFDTAEEAGFAKQSLGSTHLYGRKLVIEYEKGSQQN